MFENVKEKVEEIEMLVQQELNERLDELLELLNVEQSYIKNLDNFIARLKIENLYTSELENFIEEYMRYYND